MPKASATFDLSTYTPVAERIRLFYERFPAGRIVTELVSSEARDGATVITFRALAYRSASDTEAAATGWAAERDDDGEINAVACLENAETSMLDPATGRFTQEDPIGLAGGLNLYGYAAGDPVTYSDPLGLCKVQVNFTDFPTIFGAFYNHTFITAEDEKGSTYHRGGKADTKRGPAESVSPSEEGERRGEIRVEHGDANDPKGVDYQQDPSRNPPPMVVLDNDESCDKYNASFRRTAAQINAKRIKYNNTTTNSNAVTTELLRRAGLNVQSTPTAPAPGWGTRLLP